MRRLFLILVFWGTIPAFFIDPFYGIVHYTLINIIRPEQLMWGWRGAVGRIFYASQAACFMSWFINREKLTPDDTPTPLQVKIMWILALEMVIVTFGFAFDQDWSWNWTIKMIKMSVFCFVMSKAINTAKKLDQYYVATLVWLTLLALWGIQQSLGGNVRMEGLGGDQLPDANGLAALYVLYFPMTYYSLFNRKKWIKLFVGIPTFIVFGIFILFSGSRGAFLGLAVCILWIFLRAKGTQKFKMVFTLVVVGGLLIAVLRQFAPPEFFDEYTARLSTILGEEDQETGEIGREGSSAGRVAMWKGALTVYKNNSQYWLFGVGIDCYPRMYKEHFDEIFDVLDSDEVALIYLGGKGGKQIHNSYIGVLLGGGAVMFLTWLFLIFYAWFQSHNVPRNYPKIVDGVDIHNYALAIEAGLVGYCVCMLFVNIEFIDFFYWYLTMPGIIANLGKAKLQHEELGQEDEEFVGESVGRPKYALYPH